MHVVLTVVAIVATVIVVARLAGPLGVPTPIALLVVGIIASEVPFVPAVPLSPDLVLTGLLPPLLYAAAQGTSIVDIRAYLTPILGLSVGLVLFTAVGVGLIAHALMPISLALAIALGAIVAPPDAVATTAVAKRIGLPRQVTTILEGESLLNDATALVTLRTALAVAGFALAGQDVAGSITGATVAAEYAWSVLGGVGIGVVVALALGWVRARLTEPAADTALSWLAPFVAYLAAEEARASGVFAVVTAGLVLAHGAPVLQSAASRISERSTWSSITFVLENAVFLLIGLQLASIVDDVNAGGLTIGRTLLVAGAILAAVIVLRPVWLLPFSLLIRRPTPSRAPARMANALVASWAGMRGVVTLAAALTLPANVPYRQSLIMIALVVTVGTLLLQGLTLPAVARLLRVQGPDPREDALEEATVVQAVTAAGLRALDEIPDLDADIAQNLRSQSTTRVNRVWERITELGPAQRTTPSEAYRSARLTLLGAERLELLSIRSGGRVNQPIVNTVLSQMDVEEAALMWGERRVRSIREAPLRAPEKVSGGCVHLRDEPLVHTPATPEGCQECLAQGRDDWVALRMCTHCGHVGCCDSSTGRHATAHFTAVGHPVMRSLEPGELWRWCYLDELLG
ncbi:MAG: Na+/H+ antiporter [Nostocoides sp.]